MLKVCAFRTHETVGAGEVSVLVFRGSASGSGEGSEPLTGLGAWVAHAAVEVADWSESGSLAFVADGAGWPGRGRDPEGIHGVEFGVCAASRPLPAVRTVAAV